VQKAPPPPPPPPLPLPLQLQWLLLLCACSSSSSSTALQAALQAALLQGPRLCCLCSPQQLLLRLRPSLSRSPGSCLCCLQLHQPDLPVWQPVQLLALVEQEGWAQAEAQEAAQGAAQEAAQTAQALAPCAWPTLRSRQAPATAGS
jgi:hypothetical protein